MKTGSIDTATVRRQSRKDFQVLFLSCRLFLFIEMAGGGDDIIENRWLGDRPAKTFSMPFTQDADKT